MSNISHGFSTETCGFWEVTGLQGVILCHDQTYAEHVETNVGILLVGQGPLALIVSERGPRNTEVGETLT